MPRKSEFDKRRPSLGKTLDHPIKLDTKPELSSFLYCFSDEYKEEYERKLKEYNKEASKIIITSKLDRMFALMQIYSVRGVDINDPWALLINIVDDFVPAFNVQTGITKGKKTEWTPSRLVQLWDDVKKELDKQTGQKSVLLACKVLLNKKPYSSLKGNIKEKLSPEALENRYSEAKNSTLCIFLERLENDASKNTQLLEPYKEFIELIKKI